MADDTNSSLPTMSTVVVKTKPVFFAIEVSDYGNDCDVLEICMKCGPAIFKKYIDPTKKIDAQLTEINHLTTRDGRLYRDDVLLESEPLRDVLEQLLVYFKRLNLPCNLLGFRLCYNQAHHLIRIMKKVSMEKEFSDVIAGFTDTRVMFKKKFPNKETEKFNLLRLARETDNTKWPDTTKNAGRSAKRNAFLLEDLTYHHFPFETWFEPTKSFTAIMESKDGKFIKKSAKSNGSLSTVSTTVANKTKTVFFAIEVSDYGNDCDILEICMKCGPAIFRKYINPTKKIDVNLTEINHLTTEDGRLYRDGALLKSQPLRSVLKQLLAYFKRFELPCNLLSFHMCCNQAHHLFRIMKKESMEKNFSDVIAGFTDTRVMLKKKFPNKEAENFDLLCLARETDNKKWPDNINNSGRSARRNAFILEDLIHHHFPLETSFEPTKYFNALIESKIVKTNKESAKLKSSDEVKAKKKQITKKKKQQKPSIFVVNDCMYHLKSSYLD